MKKQDWHGFDRFEKHEKWLIYNHGDEENEIAKCSVCGREIHVSGFGKVYSLPICCAGCGAHLHGFEMKDNEK